MIIRKEEQKDFNEIYDFVKIAFSTAKVKDGDEQDFVNALRVSQNYIPNLALVAIENSKIIGHVMFTKTYADDENGSYEALLLAPVAVALEYRNKGVGSALINEGFKIAKEMGYTAVFLCGDPNYYSRFGFNPLSKYEIENLSDIPSEYVQACELFPDALKDKKGKYKIV